MIIHHIPLNVPAHQKTEEEREREGRGEEEPGGGEGLKDGVFPTDGKPGKGRGQRIRRAGSGKVKAITIILLII